MEEQKNVLLITNAITDQELNLIKDAMTHANTQKNMLIKLHLVHVIPNLPTCYFNIPSMVSLAEQYYEEAKKTLTNMGDALSISKKNQWLITGRMKSEVLRLAGKLNTHFILANSGNIQDLHKSFSSKKQQTGVSSINNIGKLVNQLTSE